jgi:hypothetical protein
VLPIAGISAAAALADNGDLRSQFLRDAPKGWQKWADSFRQVDVRFETATVKVQVGSPEEVRQKAELQYFYNGDLRRRHFFRTLDDGRRYEAIRLRRADEYLFDAERFDNGPFVVTEYVGGKRPASEDTIPPELQFPYVIEYRPLDELVKNPRFSMIAADAGKDASGDFVRIEFKYDCAGEKVQRFDSGWIDFSPTEEWAVRQYRIRRPDGTIRQQVITYGKRVNDFQPLERAVKTYFEKDGTTPRFEDRVLYTHFERREIPPDFFSFAAAGVPEITAPQRDRWRLVMIFMGFALLALAFVIRKWLTKKPVDISQFR